MLGHILNTRLWKSIKWWIDANNALVYTDLITVDKCAASELLTYTLSTFSQEKIKILFLNGRGWKV